jgi:deazaflavin-dependent oxidoreductase (nitroreductase family)
LVPLDRPRPFFRWWFKQPLVCYKLGLGDWIGRQVLLLTTIGRKSGKRRTTPLGYTYQPAERSYYVASGWDGHTDWYRNLRANPHVHVRVGRLQFDCVAEAVSMERRMRLLAEYHRRNPFTARIWPRWTGVPFDGTESALCLVAQHFPAAALRAPTSD